MDERLRFADGPGTHVERVVAASPEVLWPMVSDITLPTETSDELQRVEWLEADVAAGEVPRVGARFVGHNARGDVAWSVTCEVAECRPPSDDDPTAAFAWTPLVDPDAVPAEPLSTFRFDLEPVDGGTLVRQSARLGPGRSGVTWAIRQRPDEEHEILVGRLAQFRENMQRTLDLLAERASG